MKTEEAIGQFNRVNKKIENGEYLTYKEEEEDLVTIINASYHDLRKYLNHTKDMIYVWSFNYLNSPDDKRKTVETMLNRINIKPLDILNEHLNEFKNYFNPNHSNHFIQELSRDCHKEIDKARKDYKGEVFKEQVRLIKLKIIYLKIRAEREYDDYLYINNCEDVKFKLAGEDIYVDKSILFHVFNRHMIRNHFLNLQYQKKQNSI